MRDLKRRILPACFVMMVSVLFCAVPVFAKPIIIKELEDVTTEVEKPVKFTVDAENIKSYDWAIYDPDDLVFRWGEETLKNHCAYTSLKKDTVYILPTDTWLNGKLIICHLTGNDSTSVDTNYATITVNPKPTPTPEPVPEPPAKGTSLKDSSGTYEVTGEKTVAFKAAAGKNKLLSIPAELTIDGWTFQVTEIADSACKGNKNLIAVEIAAGLTKIGDKAFYGCTNLTSFEIGPDVKAIGASAFYNCKKLQKMTFPKNLESIGAKAFYKCKKLKTYLIKTKKLTKSSIGAKAFAKGYVAVKVDVPGAKKKTYAVILKSKGMSAKAVYY